MPVSFKEYIEMQAARDAGEIDEATILDRFKSGIKTAVKAIKGDAGDEDQDTSKNGTNKIIAKRDAAFEKRRAEFEARKAKRPKRPESIVGTVGTAGTERSRAHDRTAEVYGFGKLNSSQEPDVNAAALTEAKQDFEVGYVRMDNNTRGRTKVSASNAKAARSRFLKLHIGMRVIWVKPVPATTVSDADNNLEADVVDEPNETSTRRSRR